MGLEFIVQGRVLNRAEIEALAPPYGTKKFGQHLCELQYGDVEAKIENFRQFSEDLSLADLSILDMANTGLVDPQSGMWNEPLKVAGALRNLEHAFRARDPRALGLLRHVLELYPTSSSFEKSLDYIIEDTGRAALHFERLHEAGETAITFLAHY